MLRPLKKGRKIKAATLAPPKLAPLKVAYKFSSLRYISTDISNTYQNASGGLSRYM